MSKRRFLWISCTLFLFFYMGDAFLTSYYSHFFIANSMDPHQQSILLGSIPLALLVGCLVFSPMAKDSGRALILFRICGIAEIALCVGFAFCHSFWSLLPITILIGFFNGAPFAFLEGYTAPRTESLGIPYSTVRMFGTVGYLVALLAGYFILSNLPVRDCYYFAAILFGVAIGISFLLSAKLKVEEKDKNHEKPVYSKKLVRKSLIIFLLSQFFLFGAFNGMSYLLPVRLKELGLADQDYSLIRGFGMLAEVVTMLVIPLFAKKFRRYKIPMLVAALLFMTVAGCGIFVSSSFGLAYSSLLLSGIGKAFYYAYLALFLNDIVGDSHLPGALTMHMAAYNLASAGLNLASSYIYQAWGFSGYFILILAMEAAGAVLICLIRPTHPAIATTQS